MPRMTGSAACVETLRREGVDVMFGLPGGAIMPFYDALVDCGIRHVLVRHEQCAGHMADGYARATGRVGVCVATSGPGATNLVTGIATAYTDSSPIVGFTGQVATPLIGTEAFQEADVVSLMSSITKKTFQPTRPEDIPTFVRAAFAIAKSGRPGPVIVDFPRDVQSTEAEVEFQDGPAELPKRAPEPDPSDVASAVKLLTEAEKPLILVGGGARISNATPELVQLAEQLRIPVATTFVGKGCMPENHPLALGTIGMHGRPYANVLVTEADVILAVGCRFSDRSTSSREFGKNTTLIHVDVDSSEIGKAVQARVPIVGDAKRMLHAMLSNLPPTVNDHHAAWLKHVEEVRMSFTLRNNNAATLRPPKLLKELRMLLPADAIITTDVGQHQMWAGLFFDAYHPRSFLSSAGLGSMGFGFPAALGAKVGKPDHVVVNIAGDGSFLMTEQELACSVTERIPVIVVIINNRTLGMVAQWQRTFFGGRYSAVHLGNSPDFVKLAEAYGAQGFRVGSYEEFRRAIKTALKSDVTTVVDVPISPEDDVYPFVVPGKPLHTPLLGAEYEKKLPISENGDTA